MLAVSFSDMLPVNVILPGLPSVPVPVAKAFSALVAALLLTAIRCARLPTAPAPLPENISLNAAMTLALLGSIDPD